MNGVCIPDLLIAQNADGTAKVLYESKDGKTQKSFDALDWLVLLTTHIPDKKEQIVRYYGYYSNESRSLRKKAGRDNSLLISYFSR